MLKQFYSFPHLDIIVATAAGAGSASSSRRKQASSDKSAYWR